MLIIARAEFQDRGSEHRYALEFYPNKPPDYHLDIIGTAAFTAVTFRGGEPKDFDLREVEELATNLPPGLLKPGDDGFLHIQHPLEAGCTKDLHGATYAELVAALHQCGVATAWYGRMIFAQHALGQARRRFRAERAESFPRGRALDGATVV
jgi:hypothetical protein